MTALGPKKLTILVVEDRKEDVELVEIALRRARIDCEIRVESSVAGARIALADPAFDVVLTDYSLGDGNGTEVIAAALAKDPELPVIMISGTLGEDFAVNAMRVGAADYLLKSQFSRLPQAIDRAIESAALRREKKKALAALAESREQLASIVDSAMDAILTIDVSERIVQFNDAARVMFRCSPEDAIGRSVEKFIPERFRPSHHQHIRKFGESGVTRRQMGALGHVVALRADGSEISVEASISQLVREGVRYYTVILRDVTERIWAEEERRRLMEQFLAAQKFEGLGVIAGGVAHDFNNLLTAIVCNCEIARLESTPAEERRSSVDHALVGLRQLSSLTRQLLTFAGESKTQFEPIRVPDIARELGDVLRNSLGGKVQLVFNFAPGTPQIQADRSQILQLLLNLAVNGAQACGNKGGRIEISTRSTTVARGESIDLEPGEYCEVSVTDDGCGMDDETRARIFDPFFTTKPGGKGLGLAAVRGIARNHGAPIEVESKLGVGTTFRMLFRARAAPSGVVPTPKPSASSRQRVLIVDDEPLVHEVMKMILENRGYRVYAFDSPTKALAAFSLAPQRYCLAIVDLTMPILDGFEVGARMREIRIDVPLLFTSGFSRSTVTIPSRIAARSDFLEKPFTAADLVGRVRTLVESEQHADA